MRMVAVRCPRCQSKYAEHIEGTDFKVHFTCRKNGCNTPFYVERRVPSIDKVKIVM